MRNVRGIGGTIRTCGDDGTQSPVLELRLGADFKSLKLTIGQDQSSQNSVDTATVQFVGNGKQLDSQRLSFYKPITLTENLSGIVALQIRVLLDNDSNCVAPATVVLTGVSISA